MSKTSDRFATRAIHWWDKNFLSHPWLVILLFLVACGFTLRYTMENLKVNTNTADMISTEVPFQKNRIELEKAFPQDINTITLLVEGQTPEATAEAVNHLGAELRKDPGNFKSVYIPDEGEFFAKNGLLYLSQAELENLATQLANAQPFIGRIAEDNTLNGFLGIMGEALKAMKEKTGPELDLNPLLVKIDEAVAAVNAGRPYRLSWQQLMLTHASGLGVTKRFVIIAPVLHYEELLPAEQAIGALDRIIAGVTQQELGEVRVRKTGEVVLEHEEMQTIGTGVSIASFASLVLVCLTLWFAYRSLKLMFATFVSLTLGLIFSLGFATVAIGQLNLISIGFAVLFIGMGDAYSSHFCLRYRELVLRGLGQREALLETLASTGSALILSAITAAIGLYSYIPTHYSGVAELGIIAGTSMFIALATTFTVLPALMKIMPIRPRKRRKPKKSPPFLLSNWPLDYARTVRVVTVILALGSVWLLRDVEVDFNPINLRDPNTESVKTFKYLLQSEDTSPMTLSSLARSEAEAREREARFLQLPSVDRVMTIFDLIPEDQDEKLAIIADLSLIMGTQLSHFPPPAPVNAKLETVEKFHQAVRDRLTAGDNGVLVPLDRTLTEFRAHLDAADPETRQTRLNTLQSNLLNPLPLTIDNLRDSLDAEPITLDSLPKDLVERWISPNGLYRLQIYPKKDLNDLDNLREFILEAQKVDPNVTDLPVTYLESMNEAITAFQQAFAIALVATTLILLLVLRSFKDTLLVLLPLLLASLFTAAATVLLDIPFNFANIIALPLLFGLGVDGGIHMAHRLHYLESNKENLLGTSEAQGVFYGALTTVFSFSSLAFTSHQGTASMGLLLTVGLMLTLICALVVLPAFSTLRVPRRR
jgi:hopanoid biosynthesis associated RND transporter like protein HpnN